MSDISPREQKKAILTELVFFLILWASLLWVNQDHLINGEKNYPMFAILMFVYAAGFWVCSNVFMLGLLLALDKIFSIVRGIKR